MSSPLSPLWQCPKCGERFVTRNLWHSCGRFDLRELFAGSEAHMAPLFDLFTKLVRACGPVALIPQKTRAVFQVRIRFAAIYPRRSYLLCGLLLGRKLAHPRFVKVETYTPRCLGHYLRLAGEGDLDTELSDWVREAYEVGEQRHLDAV
jgi:hypothetical protein